MRKTLFFVCILLLASAIPAAAFLDFFSGIKEVKADNGLVMLDLSDLAPGQARHYRYKDGERAIRFFLVRDEQGTVRAALDACEVCWREGKGYKLQDGAMICVNCGQPFALSRIGEARGGCNPHPLTATVQGQSLSISADELAAGGAYMAGDR